MTRGRSILAAGALLTGALAVFHIAAVSAQSAAPRPPQPQVAKVVDLMQMMAALPDAAPAQPKQPRKVLVLAKAAGYVHSSIPLATRTIEALGQKTGAWTTVITYNPADINTENLKQYDAIFLASTTGTFLDDPADQAATNARRAALLEFVRSGKGDRRHPCRNRRLPRHACRSAAASRARTGTTKPPKTAAWRSGRTHRPHRRLLQVPLVFPDADLGEAGRPREPDQRAVQAATGSRSRTRSTRSTRTRSRARRCTCWPASTTTRCRAEIKAKEPVPQRTDHDYALSYIHREGTGTRVRDGAGPRRIDLQADADARAHPRRRAVRDRRPARRRQPVKVGPGFANDSRARLQPGQEST